MAAFAFKAVNARGKNTNGVLEGDNARQVRQQLREKGLIPLEVEQVAERAQSEGKGLSFSLFKPRISASDLALLTRQLATLVESALPVEEALLAVAEQCEKPRQKNMMMAVRSKVVEGHGLADALGQFPSVFDELYRAMVAAGEKSGHLDTVLNRLADYTERRQQTRSQITQAMIYPSLMLFFCNGYRVAIVNGGCAQNCGAVRSHGARPPGHYPVSNFCQYLAAKLRFIYAYWYCRACCHYSARAAAKAHEATLPPSAVNLAVNWPGVSRAQYCAFCTYLKYFKCQCGSTTRSYAYFR